MGREAHGVSMWPIMQFTIDKSTHMSVLSASSVRVSCFCFSHNRASLTVGVSAANAEGAQICLAKPSMRIHTLFLQILATDLSIEEQHQELSTLIFAEIHFSKRLVMKMASSMITLGLGLRALKTMVFRAFHISQKAPANMDFVWGQALEGHKVKTCFVDSGSWSH